MFASNHLIGFGVGDAAGGPATIGYLGHAEDSSGGSTTTIASQPLGTASSDRIIAIAVHKGGTGSPTVSAMTVAGVSMTFAVGRTSPPGDRRSEIWYGNVPSGTTGTVVVTWTGAAARVSIGIFEIHSATLAPTTTADDGDTGTAALTLSANTTAGGVVVGAANSDQAATWTWVGLTKDDDVSLPSSDVVSYAHAATATASTPLTITATPSANSSDAGVVAVWAQA